MKQTPDEMQRRITELEAAQVKIEGTLVRHGGKLLLISHTIEGDGVPGMARSLADLLVWQQGLPSKTRELVFQYAGFILALVAMGIAIFK
jgi:hypothetical protein